MSVNVSENARKRPAGRHKGLQKCTAPEVVAEAARCCFRDAQTDEQIAAAFGVSRRTLARWKHHPEFQRAYAEEEKQFQAKIDAQVDGYLERRQRQAMAYGVTKRDQT